MPFSPFLNCRDATSKPSGLVRAQERWWSSNHRRPAWKKTHADIDQPAAELTGHARFFLQSILVQAEGGGGGRRPSIPHRYDRRYRTKRLPILFSGKWSQTR